MYYLKKFATDADYLTYINGEDVLLPNVSYCASEVHVHYNPFVETRLVAIFDVQDANPTLLYQYGAEAGALRYNNIEIDGVEVSIQDIDENNGYYDLPQGQHTVKYTLIDPTTIGDAAFAECFNLVSITIPNSVITIGQEAFVNCSNLESVTIGDSVTSIGRLAFSSCNSLTSITSLATTAPTIDEYVFDFDYNKGVLTIPQNSSGYVEWMRPLTNKGWTCNIPFLFCKLTLNSGEIVELKGGEELDSSKISPYKSTVKSAEIGELCTTIGQEAFSQCSGLTSVNIPDSVTSIGSAAFAECSNLTSVDIPDSVTNIGDDVFGFCSNLTSADIPNGVTSIGNGVFVSCSSLESITIPNSVTSIGNGAFAECSNLTSVTIPNSVTSIGVQTFASCTGLASVSIGNGVTSIGTQAFSACSALANVTSLATTAPTIQSNTFQNVMSGGTLTVPSGSTGYDVWMRNSDYYLGKYNWTKVEQ